MAIRAQKVVFEVHGEVLDDGVCVFAGKLGEGAYFEAKFGTTLREIADIVCEQMERQLNAKGVDDGGS